ncbi:MAG: hypothetical protein AVO35_12585 [Candidatus Aegiribacteria sp. MLS_C]|nr:MAG: hypothetical protein AVO35_12585 [Candidatus Aegiribacteria sp. MLS_C]
MKGNDGERLERRARVLSALANPVRLKILEQLSERDMSVSELTEVADLDISTVSRHLGILRQTGIVSRTACGTTRLYSLSRPCVLGFLDCVDDMLEEGSALCATDFRKRMENAR